MKTVFKTSLSVLFCVLFLFTLLPMALASEARKTATIGNYSAIDINDLYLFRDPRDSTKLVVALTTQPLADPLFGDTYHFQPNALYRINFTTQGNAKPTEQIDFVFGPFVNDPTCPPPQPACQTYTATFSDGTEIHGFATPGVEGTSHAHPSFAISGNITVFAGPREDPFFFDFVGFRRAVAAGDPGKFTGVDAFKGKNANAIVVELPLESVFPASLCQGKIGPVTGGAIGFTTLDGKPYPCGAWAVTYLGNFKQDDVTTFEAKPEGLRQIDRVGNPLVGSFLVPSGLRDGFNFGEPKDDPKDFLGVISNQILALDKTFGTCPPSATDVNACNPNAPLLVSLDVPDTLRFAVNMPDGYPNGRRLFDRTTDLLISLILQVPGFTDGTSAKHYCLPSPDFPGDPTAFPFLAPPLQLTDATIPPVQPTPLPCP